MKLLIVEDDRVLAHTLCRCLESTYDIDQAFDGAEGFYYARQNMYDLIILDLMLPEMNGYQVLEKLRAEDVHTPVLILTAKGTTADKTQGFRSGADDYLVKPFDKDELTLRIEAILRRTLGTLDITEFSFKDLVMKTTVKQAWLKQDLLPLKGKQYDALEYLVSRQGRLVSKGQLFDKVWGFMTDTSSNVVEVYISAIRKILKPYGYDIYLQTIRGAGYIFSEKGSHE